MSGLIEFLFPTPEAGLAWGLGLIAVGLMIHEWVRRELSDRRRRAAQDQAIAIAGPDLVIKDVRPAGSAWPDIPVQRVTNGEDLIGGGL